MRSKAVLGIVTGADGGYILGRSPDTVVAPDAAFVRTDRLPQELPTYLELGPDLVVEVVSPTDWIHDVADKVRLYLNAGTQLIWIIQLPLKTVTVHYPDHTAKTFTTDDNLDGGDVLLGFTLAVADIFS